MDEKTLQALTALANKLGTTTEYLWGVLLKQAPITGLVDLGVMISLVVATYWWFRLVQRKTTPPPATEEDRYPSAAWTDDVGIGLAWMSIGFMVLICILVIATNAAITIAALFNPEYWALMQILR